MPRKSRGKEIFTSVEFTSKIGGVTTVLSGTASIVVSASGVKSGSPILVSPYGIASVNSGFSIGVDSVVNNTSFMVVTARAVNVPAPVTVSWVVIR
jgi:energy-converting hydrogenase Eha subunit F